MIPYAAVFVLSTPVALAGSDSDHESSTIEVSVTGLRSSDGRVLVYLYRDKSGFPTKTAKAYKRFKAKIVKKKAQGSFTSIPPGRYAVTVIHDEDSDGKLLTGLLGIPKEGVGVSGNGSGMPRWKKASFVLDGESLQLKIKMRYL